ncbi:helix-turn-helix domain-containing protein [Weissella uvarum]|uniref:helix-turn-helix domain-containing protein n=1 Tax=Weissella uvarum TaxID=1479233 RepID=UPI0019604C7B|nr:helix-turn-helix domain-containing protein [Weissella uvarum]
MIVVLNLRSSTIVIQKKQRKNALSFDERLVIEDLWLRQYSISRIARYLERSRYEIEQELKRGNVIYFQGLSEHELKLMTLHKRIKYMHNNLLFKQIWSMKNGIT